MLTSEIIKQKAAQFGATVCGIGDIKHFEGELPQRDPKMILPSARCVIGAGFRVPKGLYEAMDGGSQFYTYTTMGVKYIDEEFAEIFLLKMAAMIEDEGYDACVQRSVPNLRIRGDKSTNPEVNSTYEMTGSEAVEKGKPAPDVIIDYNRAAVICGLGSIGLSGKVIAPKYGPYMRFVFIITDAPLETDKPFTDNLCDRCGECVKNCPGNAISEYGLDTWQCAVYYRGAHKSNPFMTGEFLKGNPDRERIINGDMRFNAEAARAVFKEFDFLPQTQSGYVPCLCGKRCETACYKHLKEMGII